jgi:pyruvate/2-oxoglutarate dehydrogenase complex dihydrolipoamide acyltransferase (E2) component
MTVCLTLDQRVLDAMAGALFLESLAAELESPAALLEGSERSLSWT